MRGSSGAPADAAFAADEDGGVAVRDLLDEIEGALHGVRAADHVRGPELFDEFLLEPGVLFEEHVVLLLGFLAQAHGLGDHGGDDTQVKADVF